jgi:UDP-N-acetylmuramoyl-tripeptide--D-alanyl-D-alanine ligase
VLEALQQLARHHRLQFDIPVVAIGGSNGKTTTKELTAAVLSSHYPCHFTKGNFNNHIGVPLTLLAMPPGTEVAIIEMGTNQPGDIDQLCHIALPTHGLITNIGKEHLEGFGSLEGVKKAEKELYDYLRLNSGCVFVNQSERYLAAMAKPNRMKVGYQMSSGEELPGDGIIEVELLSYMPFVHAAFISDEGPRVEIRTRLYGRHNFNNVMTAIALGIYFKVPAMKIRNALEQYTPSNNRSQVVAFRGAKVLLDAYNANPSSMRPALDSLVAMPAKRKIAILGDMLELGQESEKEHEAIMRLAVRLRIHQLVLVGPEFGKTSYRDYGVLHFADNSGAKDWLDRQELNDKTLILIKGSRGIRLETLVQ